VARQQTAAGATKEGASRLGGYVSGAKEETKKKQPDMVGRIQAMSAAENKRKEEEAKKKKAGAVTTAPEDGFLTKMYKKYIGGGDK